MKKYRIWMALGALFCGIYVVLGAFGAHGLQDKLDVESLTTYKTGLRYLMMHGIGLILVNFLAESLKIEVKWVNIFFCVGIALFSFSLIIHACRSLFGIDVNAFALVAPIGGLAYVAGWILFSFKLLKS